MGLAFRSARMALERPTACRELSPHAGERSVASHRLLRVVRAMSRKRGTRESLSLNQSRAASVCGPMLTMACISWWFFIVICAIALNALPSRKTYIQTLLLITDLRHIPGIDSFSSSDFTFKEGLWFSLSPPNRRESLFGLGVKAAAWALAELTFPVEDNWLVPNFRIAKSWAKLPAGRHRQRIKPLPKIFSGGRWDGPSNKMGCPASVRECQLVRSI